jgi:hypothetical protein
MPISYIVSIDGYKPVLLRWLLANASQTSPIVTMKRQLKQSAEAYHSAQIPLIGYTPQGRSL